MTAIDLAYFNYEHGGTPGSTRHNLEFGRYDYAGLVRVMGEDGRWPHLFVMGEGDYYDFFGGRGMWGAVEAMRNAGGRAYVPLPCALPRQWGPFAPVIFYDAQVLIVVRWYDHRAPDFAARNRNLLMVKPVGGEETLHVSTTHGDLHDPLLRWGDARCLRWLASDDVLGAVLADWNEVLSGPHHEPTDLDDPTVYDKPWLYLHRLHHINGHPEVPRRLATYALDYLCGYWDPDLGKRVEGIGFVDACEHAGINTPTNLLRPSGRQPTQIDHILLNRRLAERIVPDSVRVHEPLDPDDPDSDHKRVSVTVDI